jgi:hypothetical protein
MGRTRGTLGRNMRGIEREGKRPLERCRHEWEDTTKMDLKGIGCECMD